MDTTKWPWIDDSVEVGSFELSYQHTQSIILSGLFLFLFSRLKTGWSSRSNVTPQAQIQQSIQLANLVTPANKNSPANTISDAEFLEIEHVMQRANLIEQKETNRIRCETLSIKSPKKSEYNRCFSFRHFSKLYQRYVSMNRPQGNGETTCLICNCNFGLLGATPRICNDCLKVNECLCQLETWGKFLNLVPTLPELLRILLHRYAGN